MAFRRLTYSVIVFLTIGIGLWYSPAAEAAPPQFNAALKATTTRLSPFPVPDRKFIFALTLDQYFPLAKLYAGKEYDFSYDTQDSLLTYKRNTRRDQSLIPVSNDVKAFVDRRVELSLRTMSADINRGSLVKEQQNKAGGLLSITIPIRSRTFESLFGEGGAGLKVSGYRKITFSGRSSWTDGQSSVYAQQSKFPALNMEQVYRFDINGTIGSKISVSVSQDSRNDLPLANRLILRYKGAEDDVLQSIEAGNTTLDLPATQFLRYSTRVQGLFGLKASAKIADLSITAIASQEKGSTEAVEITAGSSAASTRVVREVEYRRRTIFDLGRIARDTTYWPASDTLPKPQPSEFDFFAGDSITLAILYRDDKPYNPIDRAGRPAGVCYVDPQDTLGSDRPGEYTEQGNFERLDQASYYINPLSFYVVFTEQVLGDDDILGAFITVRRASGVIDTMGDISRPDTLRLKLIKPTSYTKVNHHVWEYEWRNVYSLSSAALDPTGLEVNLFKGATINYNQQADPNAVDYQTGAGLKYMQILGLDRFNESNSPIPDGKIDRNTGLIEANLGLLVFPDRHPFDSRRLFVARAAGDTVRLEDRVPEIYSQTTESVTRAASKYYLTISTKERGTSVIDLRSTNIIEGSEVVTYNGATLKKGEDYDINYDMGRLTLLKDDYTDVNSNLSVMFETAPFFSLSRKTLLGTRLEYAPSRDFKVGATLLYKSDKATNRKPKVGEETSNMMVWDADLAYNFEVKPLTALVDAIPFVTTQAASNMRINAEVAQSRPNPNVDGNVYIDDFEGADENYSLGVRRGDWRFCSRPEVVDTSLLFGRGRVSWDTKDNYTNKEIWNRDEGQGTADIARVLVVNYRPSTVKLVPDTGGTVDTLPIEAESSWNGFMKDIPAGVTTQLENTQLLEMRLRGNVGIIHIDLGKISDDINGNGQPDTEDKNGNRTLEDEEDIGLDGLIDAQEPGYDPARNPDPHGDDYNASDIWMVNGTEGNRTDVTFGGTRPDMEDPDYNGFRKNNDYYSFRVDLSDTTQFYVPGTRNETGWRTIRVPLRDITALDTTIGDPSWKEIRYARIWFDSVSAEHIAAPIQIEFASIDLVSNAWADSLWVVDSLRGGVTTFDVAVINNEIDKRYQPPAGVSGYYDPTRDVTEKEQSLLLRYENLNGRILVNSPDSGLMFAADTAMAVRKFFRANNYMGYGKLEAFVHGPASATHDSLLFFLRMGTDKTAFYEFRTVLDTGWASSNNVLIDFNEITGLKAKLLARRALGDPALTIVDSTGRYAVTVKPGGQDPTLTRIQYFAMGVINLNPDQPASGEVWVDELRLTDVRDDKGMAAQVGVSGNMADLLNYTASYSTQDAYYRGISATTKGGASDNLGSGQTRTSYSFSGSIQLHKFFPRSLQLSLPVSFNWSQSVQAPLLRNNTDIVVPAELKKDETNVSVTKGFQIREKIQKNTNNIIFAALLNRFNAGFSYNISQGHAATQPKYMRENYSATANYTLGMKKIPSISPLSWTKFIKKPFDLSKTKIYLYPTQLDFAGTLTGSYSKSLNLDGANPTSTKQDFAGTMNVGYKLFDNLTGSLTLNTTRDLKDPRTVNVTVNPKKFRLGIEQRSSQSFRVNYAPNLFKFLTHSMDYSSRYSDEYKVNSDSSTSHQAGVNTNTNFSFTLKHQSLIGSNKKGGGKLKKGDKGPSTTALLIKAPLKGIRYITDAIKPVTVRYGITEGSMFPLATKAKMAYRFGFTNDPGVPLARTTSVVRQSHSIGRTVSANSGVALFSGIGVDARYERTKQEQLDNSTERVSETWPDLTFNLRSIRGLWLFGKFMNAISPSSAFNRNVEYNQRRGAGFRTEQTVRRAFAPFLGFSINISKAIRTNARLEQSTLTRTRYTETTGALAGITRSTSKGVSFDGSYSFRNPSGIRLPLFGRIKFESVMSITINVAYRTTNDEEGKAANKYRLEAFSRKTSLNVQPGASYSFSSTIKGGMSARWQDNYDSNTRRRTHTRELGLWIEMNF